MVFFESQVFTHAVQLKRIGREFRYQEQSFRRDQKNYLRIQRRQTQRMHHTLNNNIGLQCIV